MWGGGGVGGCHRLYTYNTNRNACQLLQDNNSNYNMTVIIKPSTATDSGIYIYFFELLLLMILPFSLSYFFIRNPISFFRIFLG